MTTLKDFDAGEIEIAKYWARIDKYPSTNISDEDILYRAIFNYERSVVVYHECTLIDLPENSSEMVIRQYYPTWYEQICQGRES